MASEHVSNRLSGYWSSIADQSREVVDDYPFSSLLVAFGIGVVAGMAISNLLTDSSADHSWWPTERTGHSMLEALSGVLPHSMFGN